MRRSIIALLIVLVLAGFMVTGWLSRQAWPGSGARTEQIRDASPMVVFTTVALGGFRGLIADLLWLRVSDLQERGRYFEVVQLADWITKLEPDSAEVWAFHGWNMAYNISIMFPDPPDRWRWIQNGLRLLRDEGLRYNPKNPRLFTELSMIFQHKIGGPLDDYSASYRWYYANAGMPDHGKGIPPVPDEMRAEALGWQEFNRSYNPEGAIDWRAPEAMAAYWSWRGMRLDSTFPARQCARMFVHCSIDLLRRGRVEYSTKPLTYLRLPNLAVRDGMRRGLADARRLFDDEIIDAIIRAFDDEAQMLAFAFDKRKPVAPDNADAARAIERALRQRLQNKSKDESESMIVDMLALAHGAVVAGMRDEADGMTRLAEMHCAMLQPAGVDSMAWKKALAERAAIKHASEMQRLNLLVGANGI